MERDDRVVVFGEDVGYFGGVFRCTQGLQERFGKHRCFDAPINEAGIVGAAIGMAAYGLRPCVEIQFADYMYPAYDQIVSEAARLRYRSAGDFTAPLTVRMPTGGGIFGGQTHSQSPEALFTHVAGLKTVVVVEPVRRQGPADRGDRGRRPGDLPRAEAALQRPVRRPPRPADRAVVAAPARRGARRPLHDADSAAPVVHRPGDDLTVLAYGTHGPRRRRPPPTEHGHRRRDHRPAHARAARRRHDRRVGGEDRPLPRRPRGDAARRGSAPSSARTVQERCFYSPRGADRTGDAAGTRRIPHAHEWVVLPGPGSRRPGDARECWAAWHERRLRIELPDVGEGVAEAELVEWFVAVGNRSSPISRSPTC